MQRQAQLGRAVNGVYHARHFSRFSEETLLEESASAQSRLVVTETVNAASTAMLLSHRFRPIGPAGPRRLALVAPLDQPGAASLTPVSRLRVRRPSASWPC